VTEEQGLLRQPSLIATKTAYSANSDWLALHWITSS